MKILFLDGTHGFQPKRKESSPCGGIATSLSIIPRLLSSYGHTVTVASEHAVEETVYGVRYITPQSVSKDHDIVIFNRNCINNGVCEYFAASKKILWLHDIVDPRYFDDDAFLRVDEVIALSEYCKETYAEFYGIPKQRFTVIPNGVDKAVFYPGDYKKRNRNLYISASAPIKGLFPIEFLYDNMKRNNPDFELRLYSSQSLHDMEDSASMKAYLKAMADKGIVVLDPIPQAQLADVMREAWCLLMPGHYPEICSNLVLQAQASGLPVIGSPIGSLPEFIEDGVTGLLTYWTPNDRFMWWKDYTEQALLLWQQPKIHEAISDSAPASVLSWEEIAKRWNNAFFERKEVAL